MLLLSEPIHCVEVAKNKGSGLLCNAGCNYPKFQPRICLGMEPHCSKNAMILAKCLLKTSIKDMSIIAPVMKEL
jgi:hypothetical protein